MTWDSEEILLRAAWYYYVDNLTQDDVAGKLGISRASAGRLLDRARQSGIVSFSIQADSFETFKVGRALRKAFGLREALVPPGLSYPAQSDVNRQLARAGSQYLRGHLGAGTRLALGWGETVGATVAHLPVDIMSHISACTLTGGVNAYVRTLRRLHVKQGSNVRDVFIPTPIVVSSPDLAKALRCEPGVAHAIELNRSANIALVGIGGVTGEVSLIQQGYLTASELAQIESLGAVGDVLGLFYDANGTVLDLEIHHRRIGVTWQDLHGIDTVVAVAGGMSKLAAIHGALKSGLINVLITSEDVARALLVKENVAVEESSP